MINKIGEGRPYYLENGINSGSPDNTRVRVVAGPVIPFLPVFVHSYLSVKKFS